MENGPVYVIEDDAEDREFFLLAWSDLEYPHPVVFFISAEDALRKIQEEGESPFLILCDVNVKRMGGFELRERLLKDVVLKHRSIPFLFWSTEVSEKQIKRAYDLSSHGFFVKHNTVTDLKNFLSNVMEYWKMSQTPNLVAN